MRLVGFFAIGICLAASLRAAPPAAPNAPHNTSAEFDKAVLPFFARHCFRCHNATKAEGELRIDGLSRDFVGGGSAGHWADIAERISTGEMPPEEEPQPSVEESAAVVEWLAAKLKEGEAARLARRERVSLHKLTREEYVHTVEDLLGVHYDATDPTGLPDDPEYHGFERIGSVLSLSPSHVEKYFAAAEAILTEAFPEKAPLRFASRRDGIELRGGPDRVALTALGVAHKVRVDLWPGSDLTGGRIGPGTALPASGYYKVRIKLSGLKPALGRAPHLAFYCVNLDRMLHEQDVVAAEDAPTTVEFVTHLPGGNHTFRLSNEVPGPSNLPRSGRADPRKPFFSIKEGRRPWQTKLTDEEGRPLMPFLIIDSVEWEGPLAAADAANARERYLPPESGDLAEAKGALSRFAEQAFRRPLHPGEADRFVHLVETEMAAGEKYEPAMKTAMLAILCSKDFIYLVEGSPDRAAGKLDDWELASRLSYFLWSTMPDAELFDAARSGKLHDPSVLQAQVRRMLADPKARRFAEAFPRQWLQLRQVGMFPPDKKLYPDYDDYLQKSMVAESTEYFREVLEQNLSLREFLDSDWTMVNARLAVHYQMPRVTEDRFQRVALEPGDHRGGLLTQAAILCLTSDGTRHRPVHRGKWVSEAILGKSPPPPPANVKPIEPTPATEPKATLRMKLEAHKSDASCAACHRKIDPLGLAFDNYDAIGRWRTEEVVGDGIGDNPKVDAGGEMPDGRKFRDAEEFKALMLADLDKFNHAFVEKLATFALRRTTTYDDRAELAKIAAKSKAADYRLAEIVEALVLSDLFQKR